MNSDGSFSFAVGVMDAEDEDVNSILQVGNIYYEDNDPIEEPPEEIQLTVETYGNVYGSADSWNMSTDSGAIDQYYLENGLNLGYGTLDNSLESISDTGIKQAINATEGSGILATATAQSGDIISFNYTFSPMIIHLTKIFRLYQSMVVPKILLQSGSK